MLLPKTVFHLKGYTPAVFSILIAVSYDNTDRMYKRPMVTTQSKCAVPPMHCPVVFITNKSD